jgi:amidase
MVDATLDAKNPGFQPRNKMEKEIWEKYDPTKILGTSATLQLVGRRLQEEMVLAITAVVDAALKAAASSA